MPTFIDKNEVRCRAAGWLQPATALHEQNLSTGPQVGMGTATVTAWLAALCKNLCENCVNCSGPEHKPSAALLQVPPSHIPGFLPAFPDKHTWVLLQFALPLPCLKALPAWVVVGAWRGACLFSTCSKPQLHGASTPGTSVSFQVC